MQIHPFAAVRPNEADAAAVASVPYDVVDAAEAKALAAGNPRSFLHVSRPEIDLPPGTPPASPVAYAQARRALDGLVAAGTLVRDGEPAYYAYRQTMGAHEQTGIVACFDTKDYLDGTIRQHERTRPDKEDDRLRHIETLGAQTGPAFLTYRDDAAIDALVAEACRAAPLADFTAADGIRHTVWRLATAGSPRGEALRACVARIPVAYIADGHHRSAAAARFARAHDFASESRWFMAVLFPAGQLKILPYNRLVADLNGLTADGLLAKARAVFTVSDAADGVPAAARHARMFLAGRWYDLAWEVPPGTDVVSSLDVSVLQDRFLAPVLGIDDPRTSPRLSFMGGIRPLDELSGRVADGRAAVAFSLFPVTVREMMAIADAGAIMPPKSTWFEPKLRSGLFIHPVP